MVNFIYMSNEPLLDRKALAHAQESESFTIERCRSYRKLTWEKVNCC